MARDRAWMIGCDPAQRCREIAMAVQPGLELTNDEQAPPISDQVRRTGDPAVLPVRPFDIHVFLLVHLHI